MTRILTFVIVLFATLGCINSKDNKQVTGYEWSLMSVNGKKVETGYSLEFQQDGGVSGGTTCNHISADYQFRKEAIKFTGSVRTSMACEGANFDLEAQYALFLDGLVAYKVTDKELELQKGSDVFKYERKKK